MNWFKPSYLLFVGLGVLIALAFPVARHIRERKLRQQYYLLQGITLAGAIIGAKLSVLFGDYHWPWVPLNDWRIIFGSGRSVSGALILGFLFAEIAKPLVGYRMPPNDRFASLLPFTIAIGRLGCLTAGCCAGLPYEGACAFRGADGVPRYPTQLMEICFQLGIGAAFIILVKRGWLFGRLFSIYLIAYGVFRYLTEFVRDTPKFYGGYSGYQWLSLLMIVLGGAFFLKRTLAPPDDWHNFQSLNPQSRNLEASHV